MGTLDHITLKGSTTSASFTVTVNHIEGWQCALVVPEPAVATIVEHLETCKSSPVVTTDSDRVVKILFKFKYSMRFIDLLVVLQTIVPDATFGNPKFIYYLGEQIKPGVPPDLILTYDVSEQAISVLQIPADGYSPYKKNVWDDYGAILRSTPRLFRYRDRVNSSGHDAEVALKRGVHKFERVMDIMVSLFPVLTT